MSQTGVVKAAGRDKRTNLLDLILEELLRDIKGFPAHEYIAEKIEGRDTVGYVDDKTGAKKNSSWCMDIKLLLLC